MSQSLRTRLARLLERLQSKPCQFVFLNMEEISIFYTITVAKSLANSTWIQFGILPNTGAIPGLKLHPIAARPRATALAIGTAPLKKLTWAEPFSYYVGGAQMSLPCHFPTLSVFKTYLEINYNVLESSNFVGHFYFFINQTIFKHPEKIDELQFFYSPYHNLSLYSFLGKFYKLKTFSMVQKHIKYRLDFFKWKGKIVFKTTSN